MPSPLGNALIAAALVTPSLACVAGCGVDAQVSAFSGDEPRGSRELPELDDDALPSPPPGGLHQLIAYGQSLSIGHRGWPVLTVNRPPAGSYAFSGGIVEPLQRTRPAWLVESVSETGWAEAGRHLAGADPGHEWLVSSAGVGGALYSQLAMGTPAYQGLLDHAGSGHALAAARGETHSIAAVLIVHGEGDAYGVHYGEELLQWQSDIERDLTAITGQTTPVPTFHSQPASYGGAVYHSGHAMLDASEAMPDRMFLVGPKYMLPHSDGLHLTAAGYRWMGAYYARAVEEVVVRGGRWEPTRPLAVTRDGALITVRFHVPAPPLVFDGGRVRDPGMRGFEYHDDGGPSAEITGVALAGAGAVRITLSRAPVGGHRELRYAYSGPTGAGGPTTGPRGTLRDSEPATSSSGDPLFNWCVSFRRAVP